METLYLVLSLCVLQVHSMALKGPVLTRYQPCGLGVIYFDKITDILWRAEIKLALYQNLKVVEIEIDFEQQMALYGVSHNSTVSINNESQNFTFIPNGDISDVYHIYMSIKENTTTRLPLVKSFRLNDMLLCSDSIKANQSIDSLDVTQPDQKRNSHICGRRSLEHSEVNHVRTDAEPGDWPWHVAILIRKPFTDFANYQCGGNVISRTAILTAGHCMFLNGSLVETSRIIIEAGVTDLEVMNPAGRQTRVAERVILHPGYNAAHATSDLAIVVVNKLRYTEYVQPICVWGPAYDKTALFGMQAVPKVVVAHAFLADTTGQEVYYSRDLTAIGRLTDCTDGITGFGTTEQNVLSSTLRSTNIKIQNDTTCIAYEPNLYTNLLNEFTFCAGFGPNAGINPRNGDSGGGLIFPTKQSDHKVSWFLRGILSKCGLRTGQTYCDPKFYVIYTDVGPHYGWIYHNSGLLYSSHIIS